ncbi:hypothetical protein [Rhizobium halophytocola]|uniref:DUF4123 domain-containing protein n=1 Tax=Rhizobium halophytocola TaxID=735519 RepID=A0ABS4E664_9HYPH|nr:hypothetical protein [Rhizobium halophytocola]MBP1853434.1 hypothetical protein [Rhizobium halophytocola]
MALTQRAERRPEDVRDALERQFYDLVEGGAHRIYVVMDGARYAALPARLNAAGMSFRPLYRQVPGNAETVLGGPWLVDPYLVSRAPQETAADGEDEDLSDEALEAKAAAMAAEMAAHVAVGGETGGGVLPSDIIDDPDRVAERLRQILDVIDDRPGAVFWVTDRSVTAETLSRHLRRINQMLVARKDAPRTVRRPGGVAMAHAYERVIFRHADPNVMIQVVPALEPEQVARLLGPAALLFFAPEPEWGGGLKRIRHPGSAVSPAPGPFRLDIRQVEGIEEARRAANLTRRVDYLRQTCPSETQDVSEDQLREHIRVSEVSGTRLGLVSEGAHCRWAFVMCKTGGRVLHNREALRFIAREGKSPDDQMRAFMSGIAGAMARQTASGAA